MKLSTRPDEFLGGARRGDHAESQLGRRSTGRTGLFGQRGDGAFYGQDRLRRDRRDRPQVAVCDDPAGLSDAGALGLAYIGADSDHRPVVIHRAIFGSFEQFVALLIEHFAERVPLWLAPPQAVVLPIADRHAAYAAEVQATLAAEGLQVGLDDRQEKIGYKIREPS